MKTILNEIIAHKKIEVEALKSNNPLDTFIHTLSLSDRDFYKALGKEKPAFICECKAASPSKGIIQQNFNIKAIAKAYAPFASVISVLTDQKYFSGSFENIEIVRQIAPQPVLCKDFIIDPYQVYYARKNGADAILLMLSVLDDKTYQTLFNLAKSLNMGVLTEISNLDELNRVKQLNPPVVGINNRDLRDLSINLNTTKTLSKLLPKETIVISESGIYDHETIKDLSAFADGFLIGTSLMEADHLTIALKSIIFGTHKVCGIRSLIDAEKISQSGAVYGGLIFTEESIRQCDFIKAKEIAKIESIHIVGVFKNQTVEEVSFIANELNLNYIQLHGDENSDYIEALKKHIKTPIKIFKALDMSEFNPRLLEIKGVDFFLLDNGKGGTGKTFDWSILKAINQPFFIAGGLNSENYQEALKFNPKGLDFNSQLEEPIGVKNHQKIEHLFKTIRTQYKRGEK